MAKTLQTAAANYDRAKQFMAQAYAAAQPQAAGAWNQGMTEFLGRAPRSDRAAKYAAGYNPQAFADAMNRTSGAKWAQKMSEKM